MLSKHPTACRKIFKYILKSKLNKCGKFGLKSLLVNQWCTPLIPSTGRQRQEDLYEFKASLVYRASSRIAKVVTQRKPCFKKQTNKY